MALSNIGREPRREITESVIGILFSGLVLWIDYRWASWFYEITMDSKDGGCPIPIGMIILPTGLLLIAFLISIVVWGTHVIGEGICNALQNRGIHLRPRRRY